MTSIDVRIPDDLLEKLDRVSEEEHLDRSTVIRRLLERGYRDYTRDQAAAQYRNGEITMGEAASLAGLSLCEMEQYLIREGYRSEYSIADLDREKERLQSARKE